MRQHLTLLGDQQAGKTTALIRLAALEAIEGESVLYHCADQTMGDANFHQAVEWLQNSYLRGEVMKVVHTIGNQRILFRSGGRIMFQLPSRAALRGITPDIHVMDEVAVPPLAAARRTYRGVQL